MRNGSLNYLTNGGSAGLFRQALGCAIQRDAALLFRQVLCQEINRHDIAVRTRTGNHRSSLRRHKRMMAAILAAMHIRQVHLHHREGRNAAHRVAERHLGVGERPRVEHHAE